MGVSVLRGVVVKDKDAVGEGLVLVELQLVISAFAQNNVLGHCLGGRHLERSFNTHRLCPAKRGVGQVIVTLVRETMSVQFLDLFRRLSSRVLNCIGEESVNFSLGAFEGV